MKLLFVNACIRGEKSRTFELCQDYLKKFGDAKEGQDWEIEEINLNEMEIKPLDNEELTKRDELLKVGNTDDPMFDLAKQLIQADHILIGAPYWDFSFPAKLKIYLERCSVTGVTFVYSPEGNPEGKCRANEVIYLTTAGSPIGEYNLGYDYVKGLCSLFGIDKKYFASAEGIDIIGNDVKKIMDEAKAQITTIIREL